MGWWDWPFSAVVVRALVEGWHFAAVVLAADDVPLWFWMCSLGDLKQYSSSAFILSNRSLSKPEGLIYRFLFVPLAKEELPAISP